MARVLKLSELWRTTTVRLTALFLLIFVVFAVLLLGLIKGACSYISLGRR